MHSNALHLVVLLFVYLDLSRGILVNRTVDDQYGDSVTGVLPTYEGIHVGSWVQGATCEGCNAQPDPSLAFQGTWHDSTYYPGFLGANTVSVGFSGSAVYVFIILANNVYNVTSFTSLSFSLDGEMVGTFVQPPTSNTGYEYNVAAYVNESLANIVHVLTVQTTDDGEILFLFDYLVYSTDVEVSSPESTPTSWISPPTLSQSTASGPSPPRSADLNPFTTPSQGSISHHGDKSTGTLAGGLTGGLMAAAFITGLILYIYRQRIRNILISQNFSRNKCSLGPLTGLPASSDRGETTTGTWRPSSAPACTNTGAPMHDGSSSFLRSVITSPTEQSEGNMATYAETTTETELQVTDALTRNPGLQAPSKSAERQLHLFRQIERIWQRLDSATSGTAPNLSSRRTQREINLWPSEDVDEARILREEAAQLMDEIERLNAQRASAIAVDIRDEPLPGYTSEDRRSPVL